MAAAAQFTTWSDLYAALLNAYADFIANRIQYAEYEIVTSSTTRRYQFQDPGKLLSAINDIRPLADLESGAAVSRTYARNGGRG